MLFQFPLPDATLPLQFADPAAETIPLGFLTRSSPLVVLESVAFWRKSDRISENFEVGDIDDFKQDYEKLL